MTQGFNRFWRNVVSPKPKKAYEIFTLMTYPDVKTKFLKKYLVVSTSTPKAVSMISASVSISIMIFIF